MPNLLFVAPCEKVLIDQSNTSSLISIMEEVTVRVIPGGQRPPANAIIPMQWAVLSLWEQTSGYDSGRTFEQRTALVSATGQHLIEAIGEFTFATPRFRMTNQFVGMPISEPGQHRVKVWIREKASEPKEWKEVASFPLLIQMADFQLLN